MIASRELIGVWRVSFPAAGPHAPIGRNPANPKPHKRLFLCPSPDDMLTTLSAAKLYLRVDGTDDDALISAQIEA